MVQRVVQERTMNDVLGSIVLSSKPRCIELGASIGLRLTEITGLRTTNVFIGTRQSRFFVCSFNWPMRIYYIYQSTDHGFWLASEEEIVSAILLQVCLPLTAVQSQSYPLPINQRPADFRASV